MLHALDGRAGGVFGIWFEPLLHAQVVGRLQIRLVVQAVVTLQPPPCIGQLPESPMRVSAPRITKISVITKIRVWREADVAIAGVSALANRTGGAAGVRSVLAPGFGSGTEAAASEGVIGGVLAEASVSSGSGQREVTSER